MNARMRAVQALWEAIGAQRWMDMPAFFTEDAMIRWPNTRERFTVLDYVRANSDYPGDWAVRLCRLDAIDDSVISLVQITEAKGTASLHVISYCSFDEEKIARMDEYFSEDGEPPSWRTEQNIGERY